MVGELERRLQLDQGQVVLVGEEIVLGMDDLLAHGALHVRQLFLDVREIVLADSDADLVGQEAGWCGVGEEKGNFIQL